MAFEVGTNVVAQSQSTTRGPRPGVIEEVLRGDPSPRYRVRWDDGRETIYTPASGTLQVQPRRKRRDRLAQPRGGAALGVACARVPRCARSRSRSTA